MGDVINLRIARKLRDRAQAERAASENRAKHGLTKSEKVKARIDAERSARAIDQAKRDPHKEPSER